jgi:diadenosine tetraphosphate (Ap4A) HIT family hydrolase
MELGYELGFVAFLLAMILMMAQYPRLRRHLVCIITRHKSKLYDFLDPVLDDMFKEINLEVEEHSAEWIKDEVQRKMLEAGVYIFMEVGKRKAKEIAREILESWLEQ